MTANEFFSAQQAQSLSSGTYTDVFSLLGMHTVEAKLLVRCYLPGAQAVDVLDHHSGRKVASLTDYGDGLFAGYMGRRRKRFLYRLRIQYPLAQVEQVDPYQYGSFLNSDDVYLFSEGRQEKAYQFQGANWRQEGDVSGVWFCVWAPNAKRVSVVGDFNTWNANIHVMRHLASNGLWEIFIPGVEAGQHYKYEIVTQNGEYLRKADPYAKQMQCAPDNASVVGTPDVHEWQDANWLQKRQEKAWHQSAMSIYEVHLSSWRRKENNGFLDYQDLIEQLVPYAQEMGFTHLQLMPISEFPFDGSWGYQPVGMYAPTYRLGQPAGLKAFVDACHKADIGVLLDWVPAHFPTDEHGLAKFDGTCLYEHEDPRLGFHPDWNTLIYNYGKGEVLSFLLSNARYWLEEFHFDGLRLDAVSSMLYLDYSREPDQWLPNQYGGRENLEAIHFLRELNARMYCSVPGVCMIAEESTAWPGVTRPTSMDGLGFGFKWNMGWMNDSLGYLRRDPVYRKFHHHELTFSLMYCYSEQFILSLSHDEVVHGKGSLVNKIPGDQWQQMATLRAYYGFMWGHPGKKLLFMGCEFGQTKEWNHDMSLDWHLLEYGPHQGMQNWLKDLNQVYQQYPLLYQRDDSPGGFAWLDCDNAEQSIFTFIRYGESVDDHLIFVVNMTPSPHEGFRVGLPKDGRYKEVLNSDSEYYGGSNLGNAGYLESESVPWQGMWKSTMITIPPLSCLILAPEPDDAD